MEPQQRRVVQMPDVVGLPFQVGRDVAMKAGVGLVAADRDRAPIGWPDSFYIVAQELLAGASLLEHESVCVTVSSVLTTGLVPQQQVDVSPRFDAHAGAAREPSGRGLGVEP